MELHIHAKVVNWFPLTEDTANGIPYTPSVTRIKDVLLFTVAHNNCFSQEQLHRSVPSIKTSSTIHINQWFSSQWHWITWYSMHLNWTKYQYIKEMLFTARAAVLIATDESLFLQEGTK